MKTNILTIITILCTLLSASAPSALAVYINFDFTGLPGNQASTAGTSDSSAITNAIIDRGLGLTATTTNNSLQSSSWNSLSTDEYISIRFTVDPDLAIIVTGLRIATRSSNTGPASLGLFHNGDDFTDSLYTFNQPDTNEHQWNVSFTPLYLQGNVEFRIYALENVGINGDPISASGTFRISNYQPADEINGATFIGTLIPVPEPATYTAVCAILIFAATVLKRRARS